MQKIDFPGIDFLIVVEDIRRHSQEIASSCMEVWDSMVGQLPSFEAFCGVYMKEKMQVWLGKARWN